MYVSLSDSHTAFPYALSDQTDNWRPCSQSNSRATTNWKCTPQFIFIYHSQFLPQRVLSLTCASTKIAERTNVLLGHFHRCKRQYCRQFVSLPAYFCSYLFPGSIFVRYHPRLQLVDGALCDCNISSKWCYLSIYKLTCKLGRHIECRSRWHALGIRITPRKTPLSSIIRA
jgi:hypothetical protein